MIPTQKKGWSTRIFPQQLTSTTVEWSYLSKTNRPVGFPPAARTQALDYVCCFLKQWVLGASTFARPPTNPFCLSSTKEGESTLWGSTNDTLDNKSPSLFFILDIYLNIYRYISIGKALDIRRGRALFYLRSIRNKARTRASVYNQLKPDNMHARVGGALIE